MLGELIDNNYIMTDKGREIFDELIKRLLDDFTVFQKIDYIAGKIIKNRRSYHPDLSFNKIYFEATKYMIQNKKSLKNLILALMSCWSLRFNTEISRDFYYMFNSTFNWVNNENEFDIDMSRAHKIFSNVVNDFENEYPEFEEFEKAFGDYYNVFYDLESYNKLNKKIDTIIFQNKLY